MAILQPTVSSKVDPVADLGIHGDPEAIWRPWAAGELRSHLIHSRHDQAEQAPDEFASALLGFLGRPPSHGQW